MEYVKSDVLCIFRVQKRKLFIEIKTNIYYKLSNVMLLHPNTNENWHIEIKRKILKQQKVGN